MKINLSELQMLVLNAEPNQFLRSRIGNTLLVTLAQGIRDGVFPDTENKFGEFAAFTNPTSDYLSAAISYYCEFVDENEELVINLN